ncbi:Putative uncharacterized protein [Moritella viscosa]|uniref:tyrosine-type recombinase/integrase n=1 Tax=Moritella viscosa TaxID=80854 RepID=UPI00091094D9|nr:tyrosine-type recombinase/integrase [Moritella viscosa]SGZ06257.1 Putative uncharacterized protein [Moritella viscosa]
MPKALINIGNSSIIPSTNLSEEHIENLIRFRDRKEQFEENTLKSLYFHVNKFNEYCLSRNVIPLPLQDATVLEAFLIKENERGCKAQTLRIYAWAVSKVHALAGLEIPYFKTVITARLKIISKQEVKLGVKRKQAVAFSYEHLKFVNEQLDISSLISIRNTLLLNICYDGLLRESEACQLFIDQLHKTNGLYTANITNTKTDKSLDGSIVHLSKFTSKLLPLYLKKIAEHHGQYLFKRTTPRGGKLEKLKPSSLSPNPNDKPISTKTVELVFANTWHQINTYNESVSFDLHIDLPERPFSGHSARVGASCDLVGAGFDDSLVMRAGRWKTLRMVELYTRGVNNKFATVREFRERLEAMAAN